MKILDAVAHLSKYKPMRPMLYNLRVELSHGAGSHTYVFYALTAGECDGLRFAILANPLFVPFNPVFVRVENLMP